MLDTKHKLCGSQEEYKRLRNHRRTRMKAIQRRYDFLSERADNFGKKNKYDSAEMAGLKWALKCMKEEYEQFREVNHAFNTPQPDDKQNG